MRDITEGLGLPLEEAVRGLRVVEAQPLLSRALPMRHVLMGSVAENVVRRVSCPVLTVRPPRLTS